jgi:hypothetical protein
LNRRSQAPPKPVGVSRRTCVEFAAFPTSYVGRTCSGQQSGERISVWKDLGKASGSGCELLFDLTSGVDGTAHADRINAIFAKSGVRPGILGQVAVHNNQKIRP